VPYRDSRRLGGAGVSVCAGPDTGGSPHVGVALRGRRDSPLTTCSRRVTANMGQRQAERSYGIADHELTPTQGWSLAALRKTWNQHKNGVAPWRPADSKEAYNSGLDALARACGTGTHRAPVNGQAQQSAFPI